MGDGEMLGDGRGGGCAGGECAGCCFAQRGVPGNEIDQAAGQFRDGAAGFAILRQLPFQRGPEGRPLRDAVQVRHIRVAQRGNPRFGQDVLQECIAVRGTALLRIGEFQQLGIELRLSRFKLARPPTPRDTEGLQRFCHHARCARSCMHLQLNRDKLRCSTSTECRGENGVCQAGIFPGQIQSA